MSVRKKLPEQSQGTADKMISVSAAALRTSEAVVGKEAELTHFAGTASSITTDEAVLPLYAE